MHVDRLHLLADYIQGEVHDDDFDMDFWSCGTVACAMGHACNIPQFKELGLYLNLTRNPADGEAMLCPTFENRSGYRAAARLFEIDLFTAEQLFNPIKYETDYSPTRAEVVARIRNVANGGNGL